MTIWATDAMILFLCIDVCCVCILIVIAIFSRRNPKELMCLYCREVPDSNNPVQDAVIALSYKNPKAKTLEDVLSEKDLVSFVFLDCLDKEKIKYDGDTIEIDNWHSLSSGEQAVFEKVSLAREGRLILGSECFGDCPFEQVDHDKVVVHLDKVKAYASKIKSKMKTTASDKLKSCFCSEDWFLVPQFLDEKHNRYRTTMRADSVRVEKQAVKIYSKGIVSLCLGLAILTLPFVFLLNKGPYLTNALSFALCIFLVPSTIVSVLAYFVERTERYSESDLEKTKKIRGLRNWIDDFTNLRDTDFDAAIVWGDFVKWGYLLGVSDKAIRIAENQDLLDIVKPPASVENFYVVNMYARTLMRTVLPFPLNLIARIVVH